MGSMSLVLPVVSSTLGPTFATWINTALATIEEHDHTTGKGIKVPSAALNLNADVPLSGYSLYDAKSYRVRDAVSALTGADWARGLHAVGDDLWWCNGSGEAVQITSGTSIVGTSGSITNLPSGGAVYAAGTCVWKQTNISANKAMTQDAGRVKIRDESVTDGTAKAAILSAPEGLAADYTLTLPGALPGSGTKFLRVDSDGLVTDTVDADASSLEVSGNNLQIKDSGVTTAKIAGLAVTAAKIAAGTITIDKMDSSLGLGFSDSCGNASITSATFADILNLDVPYTSWGRPLLVALQSDGLGSGSYLHCGAAGNVIYLRLLRDSTEIAHWEFSNGWIGQPPVFCIDSPGAGTYTYKVQAKTSGSSATLAKQILVVWAL